MQNLNGLLFLLIAVICLSTNDTNCAAADPESDISVQQNDNYSLPEKKYSNDNSGETIRVPMIRNRLKRGRRRGKAVAQDNSDDGLRKTDLLDDGVVPITDEVFLYGSEEKPNRATLAAILKTARDDPTSEPLRRKNSQKLRHLLDARANQLAIFERIMCAGLGMLALSFLVSVINKERNTED